MKTKSKKKYLQSNITCARVLSTWPILFKIIAQNLTINKIQTRSAVLVFLLYERKWYKNYKIQG